MPLVNLGNCKLCVPTLLFFDFLELRKEFEAAPFLSTQDADVRWIDFDPVERLVQRWANFWPLLHE